MTHTHAESQGHRSLTSEVRVETENGQTDRGDCITFHDKAVSKNRHRVCFNSRPSFSAVLFVISSQYI